MYLNDQMLDSGALARRLLAPANNLVPVNLLSRQQASLEDAGTTGWVADSSATIARSTAQTWAGAASLAITSVGAGAYFASSPTGISGIPIKPGIPYTVSAYVRGGTAGRSFNLYMTHWNAAGTGAADLTGTLITPVTTGWTRVVATVVFPSTAAYASIRLVCGGAAAGGEVTYVDGIGFWEGAGGSWVNGGERLDPSTLGWYWDESVGRRLFVWDTINSRWQMTYGDTGARITPGWFGAEWGEASLYVRRVGVNVLISGFALAAAGIVGTTVDGYVFPALPSGWRPNAATGNGSVHSTVLLSGGVRWPVSLGLGTATTNAINIYGILGGITGTPTTFSLNDRVYMHLAYTTNDAWPTTLPGTASGTIPAT